MRKGQKHSKITRAKISLKLFGKRCCMRTEFKRGHTPWNKGLKGVCKANSGSFKKGNPPANYRRGYKITEDGIYVRIGDREYYSKTQQKNIIVGRYESLGRVKWREAHGDFDKKMVVYHKDGDIFNCDIDNLELITMEENLRRNQYKHKHNCVVCNKPFLARGTNHKYCSKACYKKTLIDYQKKYRRKKKQQMYNFILGKEKASSPNNVTLTPKDLNSSLISSY